MPLTRDGVLHVVAPAAFGGIESVVRALGLASLGGGRRVLVAALLQDNAPHPFVESLRQDGVPVVEVRCGRRHYPAEIRAVAALIRDSGVAVVHSHNYHADIVALLAARRSHVPIVTTVHGFSDGSPKNRAYEWIDRQLLRFFNAVICVSDGTRQRVIAAGCPSSRVAVIQNGYAAPKFAEREEARQLLGLDGADRLVGWVGRLSPAKGPDLLVKAAARLVVADACVVVVGDGTERERMLKLREALGIAPDRLRLIGPREDAARLLPAFEVVVLSSRSEGTPMILLEAMGAGVPVVTFAVGGIPGVLDDSSAWLVSPGDTEALAEAISDALERPTEAARRAAAARKILDERFGIEQWVSRVESIYGRILSGRPAHGASQP